MVEESALILRSKYWYNIEKSGTVASLMISLYSAVQTSSSFQLFFPTTCPLRRLCERFYPLPPCILLYLGHGWVRTFKADSESASWSGSPLHCVGELVGVSSSTLRMYHGRFHIELPLCSSLYWGKCLCFTGPSCHSYLVSSEATISNSAWDSL